jgi:hypothetical protein
MGDHEHVCLRNGTNQVSSSMGGSLVGCMHPCGGEWLSWLTHLGHVNQNGSWRWGCTRYHMMPACLRLTLNSGSSHCALTMCQPLSSGRSGIVSALGLAGDLRLRARKGSEGALERASRRFGGCGVCREGMSWGLCGFVLKSGETTR